MLNRSGFCKFISVLLAMSPGCFILMASPGSHAIPLENPTNSYKSSPSGVKMSFEYVHNLIILNASTADNPSLNLILDTGSNYCILDRSLALSGTAEREMSVNTSHEQAKMMKFQLDSLVLKGEIGEISASSLPVLRADLRKVSECLKRPVHGILGLSFLAGYVVEIDYQEKRIQFWPVDMGSAARKKVEKENSLIFNLSEERAGLKFPVLMVSGTLPGNYDCPFVVDTGFGGNLSVTSKTANRSGLIQSGTAQQNLTSNTVSGKHLSSRIDARSLTLGGVNFEKQSVQVDYCTGRFENRPGLIGNLLLQNYIVTFDYARRQLLLETKNEVKLAQKSDEKELGK